MRLSFSPSIALISSTRRFAGDLLDSMLRDPDATSRVALTIHELLENTLKYSSDGQAKLCLVVSNEAQGRRTVEVRATNRASPEQAAELFRRIDALGRAADLMGFYVGMMRDSVNRAGSGLGLARIRVEGEMELSYTHEGDEVTVTASTAAQ